MVHRLLAGTLKGVRYPDEVSTPLYHGTGANLQPGDLVEAGRPGNYVRRMKHSYATEDLESARHYAYDGAHGAEPTVYEVRPTGPIGHRADAKGIEWATEHPLDLAMALLEAAK